MPRATLAEARDLNTSPERLRALAADGLEVQREIAQNPSAPPDLLEQLSAEEDEPMRSYLAQNQSTPPRILYALCASYPEQILANPVFPRLFLENPNAALQLADRGLIALLRVARAPAGLVGICLESPRPNVQRAAAEHTSHTPEQLRALAGHPYSAVRLGVASNPATPPDCLAALCGGEPEMLVALAQNPNTPISSLAQVLALTQQQHAGRTPVVSFVLGLRHVFANCPNLENVFCTAMAARVDLPGELQELLYQAALDQTENSITCPDTLPLFAKNPTTPKWILSQLIGHKRPETRRALAERPDLAPEHLAALARDPDERVRRVLAKNPRTSPEILAALTEDDRPEVRYLAALHPATPRDVLARLVRAGSAPDLLRLQPPAELAPAELAQLSTRGHWARVLAAAHPNTPQASLEALCLEPSWEIRWALAKNPGASRSLLQILAGDPDSRVRAEAYPRTLPTKG